MRADLGDHVLDGTALGNPFRLEQHPDALDRYRAWLWDRLERDDPKVMAAMSLIDTESYLVCSCAPRPCHGHVVERAWEWMVSSRPEWDLSRVF